jgi:signal transduction histidine kinase
MHLSSRWRERLPLLYIGQDEHVELEIRDTGTGIPAEEIRIYSSDFIGWKGQGDGLMKGQASVCR